MLFFDSGRAVRCDQIKRAQWRLGQVWWLALDHLNGHDAQTPDVDFTAVLLACHDLGSHPVGCADHGCALHVGLVDLSAESEISELDITVHAE